MFKSVFEDDLSDFFYGETCTDNLLGYSRSAEGVKANVSAAPKMRFANLVAGVALSGLMTLSSFAVGAGLKSSGDRVKQGAIAQSARMSRLDERGRQELVKRLTKVREYFGLTQDDVANLININKSTLSKLERGEHFPDPANVIKYSTLLEMSYYLKEKLGNKKYAIRQLFTEKSRLFGGMTPIEFSSEIGDEGIKEVYSTFKRLYG